MMNEPGDERDPETGSFDADEWFRTQFGGQPAAEPPVTPAPVTPPPVTPPAVVPSPDVPPAQPAPPVYPPVTPPPAFPGSFAPPPPLVEPTPTMPAVLPPPLPPTFEPAPTQLTPVVEPASALVTPMVELEPTQPSEIVAAPPPLGDAATELMRQPEEGGALDELFGNDSFQEYDDTLISAVPRSSRRGGGAGGDGTDGTDNTGERAPLGRTQKILLWVAGSLVAVLALVAIFFMGTRIPLLLGPAPGAIPSPTATPSPTPSLPLVRPVGPVAPGEYAWDEIWGGECIEPFVDAWQDDVTVVDCATPHGGQLVVRAPFPLAEGVTTYGPYPGEEVLAAQMSLLCSAPGVLDLAAAGALTDVQVQGAFPVSKEQWNAGEHDYFCFVSRSSGEPLTGSLAIPRPAA